MCLSYRTVAVLAMLGSLQGGMLCSAQAQQPAAAPGAEPDLIAVLRSADAPAYEKAKACQQLALVGTKASLPVLSEMLSDPAMAHYARFALEAIPDPAVDQALRDALKKLQGKLLIGVVDSIGARRDAQAVPALITLLEADTPAVAGAAAAALGRIASNEAVAALKAALQRGPDLRPAVADACLAAADRLAAEQQTGPAGDLYDALRQADVAAYVKTAALQNAVRTQGTAGLPRLVECLRAGDEATFRAGLALAHAWPGHEIDRILIEEVVKPSRDEVRQALFLYTLGDRGTCCALSVVLDKAKQGTGEVQRAALKVLGQIGDASVVPYLLETAVAGQPPELAELAQQSLIALKGDDIDKLLSAGLAQADGKRLGTLVNVVGQRGIAGAAPTLLALLESGDSQIREAAIAALGLTAGMDEMPALIDRMVAPKVAEIGPAAKAALLRAVARVPDRDVCAALLARRLEEAPAPARSDLMDLLGGVGGEKALLVVASAAKSADEDDQNAATRVLGSWMTPDAAPMLLELATAGPDKYRVRTLRGYLRIARQLDVPTPERLAMCERAMQAATRNEEKVLAIDVLARNPGARSLALVLPCLDEAALREAAALAAVTMAEKERNLPAPRITAALEKVIQTTSDEALKARAQAALERIKAEK